jgi:hypothetical protein
MRPQPLAGQEIAGPLTVVSHADGNVDCSAVKPDGERIGDVATETDFVNIAIKKYGDPALAVSIEAERPAAGLRAHFGRLGTIAIGLKV